MRTNPGWRSVPEVWVLGALLAARAALSLTLGMGRDEAAYWYWSWHALDASYSLVMLAALRVSTALLGDSTAAVRLPVLLAGTASIALAARAVLHLGGGRRAAALAAVAVAATPTLALSGSVVHPDAFLMLAVMLFAERSAAAAKYGPGGGRLPGVAAAAALATFSKLTASLLLAPAAWVLWRHRSAHRAASAAAVILAGAAAGLAASLDPGLLRGVQEFGRFAPGLSAARRASVIAGELLLGAGPALLGLGVAGGLALRDAARRRAWPAWSAAALLFAFFAAFAVAGQAKANWFVPALALLVPPAVVAWERAGRTAAVRWLVAGSVAVTVAQSAGLALPSFPPLWEAMRESRWGREVGSTYAAHVGRREAEVSPTRTWAERAEEFRDASDADPRVAGAEVLASNDYGLAFRIAHARGRQARVRLPWDPVFARTCGGDPAPGEDLLYVSRSADPPAAWAARFADVREVEREDGSAGLHVWLCTGWHGAGADGSFVTR